MKQGAETPAPFNLKYKPFKFYHYGKDYHLEQLRNC